MAADRLPARSSQRGALYVFDEPSTGLRPLDVATLAGVFGRCWRPGPSLAEYLGLREAPA